MPTDPPALVEVFAGTVIEAEVVCSALEAAGIAAEVANEAMATIAPFAVSDGGVAAARVYVPHEDAAQAREVIASAGGAA